MLPKVFSKSLWAITMCLTISIAGVQNAALLAWANSYVQTVWSHVHRVTSFSCVCCAADCAEIIKGGTGVGPSEKFAFVSEAVGLLRPLVAVTIYKNTEIQQRRTCDMWFCFLAKIDSTLIHIKKKKIPAADNFSFSKVQPTPLSSEHCDLNKAQMTPVSSPALRQHGSQDWKISKDWTKTKTHIK